MWAAAFLLCSLTAIAALSVSRKLRRPYGRLSFLFGLAAGALAVPPALIVAFAGLICASETMGQGVLAGRDLVWSIERQGCGATTADVYTVRLGRHRWWSYTLLTSDAYPIPRAVEPAGDGAVRIAVDPDDAGETVLASGLIIPVSASGRPARPLLYDRGVPR